MTKDDTKFENNEEDISKMEQKELDFECPNCGKINQEEVVFICNRCDAKDLIFKDGFYLCPACFEKKNDRFMCNTCDSKDVKLKSKL